MEIMAISQITAVKVEKIKKFNTLSEKLYEKDGEVAPTMKVKR